MRPGMTMSNQGEKQSQRREEKLARMEGSWKKTPEPAKPLYRERTAATISTSAPQRVYPRDKMLAVRDGEGRREEERASDGDRRNVHRGLASAARGTKASKATEPKDLREHTKEFYHTGDSYKCSLVKRGRHRLEQVLKNEFQVCPRQDATLKPSTAGLPTFKVTAQRLIEFVVEKLEDGVGDHPVDCEIYGGEARAIVAAEQDVEDPKSRPTDLDLRFKIGDKSFERCRDIVEEFLVKQLSDLTPGADRSLIRQCYFQKQVVIGSDFSLLSVGDPGTGRNLDLEFASSKCVSRSYFDDATAFVIPLPDPVRRGWVRPETKLLAQSLSAEWRTAVLYIQKGQLNIEKPEMVFNGLPLYAHALSDKQLTPGSREIEHQYGAKFAAAFLEQAEATFLKGEDPLRFVKSFLRSHYPSRAVNALACLSQLLAVLRAHTEELKMTPIRENIANKLAESLAGMCHDAMQNEQAHATQNNAVHTVLKVARFAADPFTDIASNVRDEKVEVKNGEFLRLRRQLSTERGSSPLWDGVCDKAADIVLARGQCPDFDESKRADLEALCNALRGHGAHQDSDSAGMMRESSGCSFSDHTSHFTDDEGLDRVSVVESTKSCKTVESLNMSSSSSSPTSEDGKLSSNSSIDGDNGDTDSDAAAAFEHGSRFKSQQERVDYVASNDSPTPETPPSRSNSKKRPTAPRPVGTYVPPSRRLPTE